MGQQRVRSEVTQLAERWGWSRSEVLALPVGERRGYCYRVTELAERERRAMKKK